jgi:hypothetical protein
MLRNGVAAPKGVTAWNIGLLIVKIELIMACECCSRQLLKVLRPHLARIPSQLLFEGFSLFVFRKLLIFE